MWGDGHTRLVLVITIQVDPVNTSVAELRIYTLWYGVFNILQYIFEGIWKINICFQEKKKIYFKTLYPSFSFSSQSYMCHCYRDTRKSLWREYFTCNSLWWLPWAVLHHSDLFPQHLFQFLQLILLLGDLLMTLLEHCMIFAFVIQERWKFQDTTWLLAVHTVLNN